MKRTLAILTTFLIAWCPQAFPEGSQAIPTEVFKCSESGKAVYQDGLCAYGPSKPLKTHDAKGIEAPKGKAAEYAPPPRAPVALIPYTPSRPLSNSTISNTPTPCRSAPGVSCY